MAILSSSPDHMVKKELREGIRSVVAAERALCHSAD